MIQVEGVTKYFKLYAHPSDRLKEFFLRKNYHVVHPALKGITFYLEKGETVGIIGRNGAGKSTLLKILTGVLLPDTGIIFVEGKISALLELGTGFDANLTGVENIMGNGLLIGMTHEEITTRKASIIAFSELGTYITEPLRTYSSGMIMRLAFSIAIHACPQCFIVDEALSVGDAHFQQKCIKKMREFREKGGSMIFVSHDLNAVKRICDRVLVLEQGKIVADTTPEEAVNFYNRIIAQVDRNDIVFESTPITRKNSAYGTKIAEIVGYELKGEDSLGEIVSSGEKVTCRLAVQAHRTIPALTVGILIRDRFGQDVFGTNSHLLGFPIALEAEQRATFLFTLPMNISPGKYTITAALHTEENHLDHCFHWCDNLIRFEVAGIKGPPFSGICRIETELHILLNEGEVTPLPHPLILSPHSSPAGVSPAHSFL